MQRCFHFVVVLLLAVIALCLASEAEARSNRVQLRLDTSQAEAVLAALDKQASGGIIAERDWQAIFASEPYVRLKQREQGFNRTFSEEDFKAFVSAGKFAGTPDELRRTLDEWKKADLAALAEQILMWLPETAHIKATIYPVIKPQNNSFVFELSTNAAVFLYLDPKVARAQFENIAAHELHHVGFSSVASQYDATISTLPEGAKRAAKWVGAFGEGFAVLAAAGSTEVHPHASSAPEDRSRWDRDMLNFNQDLRKVENFLLDVTDNKLTKAAERNRAMSFFGDAQGAWYTVGYRMAVVVEKRFGRAALIDCMLDPRKLLHLYNTAAEAHNRSHQDKLELWSSDLLNRLSASTVSTEAQSNQPSPAGD
ncbi:MAG TPA: DUF5700 domain-containing putative Zn-dependent protease [Terriglobales bacterium]|nr:DUF5700 domain-containing putative Zn-dependent protease [Terriglobales bacterium]